jgi:WXXGXW repeat (2 copies)
MVTLMSKLTRNLPRLVPALRGAGLAASAIALVGCVAQVRVAGPPPVYVAPAPAVVDVQVREAPPPLPDYDQPPCPEDGYLWTPGYWAWGGGGYYWVPGTWVSPPRVGVLWTPAYWGFVGGVYSFHAGYWGPHVGFYGGVNYGFGYVGSGFAGGAWVGGAFSYNRAVTNVNVTVVHNTYNTTVINNVTVNKVSYNGGPGGVAAAPSAQERQFAQEPHAPPTPLQQQHVQQAAKNPALFAHANGGHPAIAATPRPAAFNAPGVVGAHGASAPPPGRGPQSNMEQHAQTPPGAPQQPHDAAQAHTAPQAQNSAQKPAFNQGQKPQNQKKKNPPKPKPKPKKEERKDKDEGGR